jgi:UDP-glucose 4-epimerase
MKKDEVDEYEGKVVLVTGGACCIGTNLCIKLAELGAEKVIILDDLSSAYEWNIPEGKNI